MSFIQFCRIIWARRLLPIFAILACLAGAMLVVKLVPPRYEAKSRVMLDIVKPDPVTGQIMASQFARAFVKTQIELIRDYRIAGKVADMFGWTGSAELAAEYARRPASDKNDFRRWLAQRIIDHTDAGLIEGSNILEIRYTSTSPDSAAKIADGLRQAYIDQMVAFRRDDAARNAQWFRQQSARLKDELASAEARKASFERENGIVLRDDGTDEESARLTALAGSAAAPATASAPTIVPGSGPNPQLVAADAALAEAAKVLGPNNPQYLAMQRQRDAIAAASRSSAPRVIGGGASGPSIGALYSAQQAKVLAQRGKVDEAKRLATDVSVLRAQYAKTTARAAELEQEGESSEIGVTVLGNAPVPQSPSFPKVPLLVAGAVGLGLVLGILAALVVELISRRVRGAEDLVLPDVPVIGMMALTATTHIPWWRRLLVRLMPRRRVMAQAA